MAKNSAVGIVAASVMAEPVAPPRQVAWQSGGFQRFFKRRWLEVVMVAPLFAYILFFMLIPVGQSIYLSFVHEGTREFTFANYDDIIHRSQFKDAVVNTLGITVMGVTMEMVVGM